MAYNGHPAQKTPVFDKMASASHPGRVEQMKRQLEIWQKSVLDSLSFADY